MGRYEKIRVGVLYLTNTCGELLVTELIGENKAKVVFPDGYTKVVQKINIIKGCVRNPYYPTLCGIGYSGEGKYSSLNKDAYLRWKGMIQRCYDNNRNHNQKCYERVAVCEEWHNFQNFAEWFYEKYDFKLMKNWCIDKDILSLEHKVYSPETCCLVPLIINNALVKNQNKNSGKTIGVKARRGRYYVSFYKKGEKFISELYATEKEAYELFCYEKDKYIIELAEEYKYALDTKAYTKLKSHSTKIYFES